MQDTDRFCSGTLCLPEVAEYVNANFIAWGGDICCSDAYTVSEKHPHRTAGALSLIVLLLRDLLVVPSSCWWTDPQDSDSAVFLHGTLCCALSFICTHFKMIKFLESPHTKFLLTLNCESKANKTSNSLLGGRSLPDYNPNKHRFFHLQYGCKTDGKYSIINTMGIASARSSGILQHHRQGFTSLGPRKPQP